MASRPETSSKTDAPTPDTPSAMAGSIFWQSMQGMARMHEHGMTHNDFKPTNMVIDAGGNTKLIDFGSASFCTNQPVIENDNAIIPQ